MPLFPTRKQIRKLGDRLVPKAIRRLFASPVNRKPKTSRITKRAKGTSTAAKKDILSFLGNISGVIHVGANNGGERGTYENFGLSVLWVEPIPAVFEQLTENIREFPKQRAVQYLLTDKDDDEVTFNIANNNGASSSILEFGMHKEIWPTVHFVDSIKMKTITLSSMLVKIKVSSSDYDALVIDTQGSELLVLKGGEALLPSIKYIMTEAADFESYIGCCTVDDLAEYLGGFGFKEIARREFGKRKGDRHYFDIVYERVDHPGAAGSQSA